MLLSSAIKRVRSKLQTGRQKSKRLRNDRNAPKVGIKRLICLFPSYLNFTCSLSTNCIFHQLLLEYPLECMDFKNFSHQNKQLLIPFFCKLCNVSWSHPPRGLGNPRGGWREASPPREAATSMCGGCLPQTAHTGSQEEENSETPNHTSWTDGE